MILWFLFLLFTLCFFLSFGLFPLFFILIILLNLYWSILRQIHNLQLNTSWSQISIVIKAVIQLWKIRWGYLFLRCCFSFFYTISAFRWRSPTFRIILFYRIIYLIPQFCFFIFVVSEVLLHFSPFKKLQYIRFFMFNQWVIHYFLIFNLEGSWIIFTKRSQLYVVIFHHLFSISNGLFNLLVLYFGCLNRRDLAFTLLR